VKLGQRKLLAPNSHFRQNNHFRSRHLILIDVVLVTFIVIGIFLLVQRSSQPSIVSNNISVPTLTPSPSPTPKPLTFAEMNALYGPCVHLPVLMYHHIQSRDAATADKQTNLTVYTDIFQSQMQYLKSKNYNVITMSDLINFFDAGTPILAKSVIITFDDGYQDFYTDAYPILSGLGLSATMFVPTGLVQNPDYLTWDEISGMTSSVLFANHTWSHKNVQVSTSTMETEISTADTQLNDHGLDNPKVFAYPFGLETSQAENYLNSLGYKVAFTTISGSTLCKKQRFDLPRIRIGNTSLSYYGF
jgi:peptidoglycan/xylan/chitin deacetylase (PgdA/CDA1 family)